MPGPMHLGSRVERGEAEDRDGWLEMVEEGRSDKTRRDSCGEDKRQGDEAWNSTQACTKYSPRCAC